MDAAEPAALLARRWREPHTLYQQHASWHEAARLDGPRFDVMVKFFATLRRDGGSGDCVGCLPKAA